jgi:hypothetical protein
MADGRGQAEVTTAGPHWIKIAPKSAVLLRPARTLASMIPAFQTDPSIPRGSVRVLYGPGTVELQNHTTQPVSVGLMFVKPDTIGNLATLTKSLKDS